MDVLPLKMVLIGIDPYPNDDKIHKDQEKNRWKLDIEE